MDIRSKRQFTPAVLKQFKSLYGIQNLKNLDGFENYVYSFADSSSGQERILRIGHSLHRPPEQISGEIHYLRHVHAVYQGTVSVPRPLTSLRGNWVETVPVNEGVFTSAVFTAAPGSYASGPEWGAPMFRKMGALLARLHLASEQYLEDPDQGVRPHWDDDVIAFMDLYLPKEESELRSRFDALMETIGRFPRNSKNYGMTHFDFHGGNFFTYDGEISLFDFDDCQYFWYAGDIAITLFYILYPMSGTPVDPDWGALFYKAFMAGYVSVRPISDQELVRIPLFLELREIDMLVCILRSFPDPENWPADVTCFMNRRKERILEHIPMIHLDWTGF